MRGLNLAEINSGNISFNKAIDGGTGLGCFLNEFNQIGLSVEFLGVRQLRDEIVENYLGKAIPNGNDFYNALDEKDGNLFYTKHFPSLSLKIIFSVGNK